MACTTPGLARAVFNAYVGVFAEEYALSLAGHPLFDQDFDQAKYDAAYTSFLKRVDTPEKLFSFAERLDP